MAARLVVLGLLVAGCQCWDLPVVNQGRRAQYYTQQSDGSYQYGFDTAEGLYQSQHGDDANEVRGQFGADGGKVEYTAGVDGFVVTSLKKPNAPATRTYVSRTPVRYATLEELATHPEQVDDTAEVKAAKASFQAAYDAAAAAADAAPDTNIITGAVPVVAVNTATYSVPAPQNAYLAPAPVQIKYDAAPAPVDASGHVVDTAEVKAAKASFQAAYDAAAAAAEAAPDTNIITGAVPVVAVNTATYSVPAPHNAYLAPAPVQIKYTGPSAPVDASGRVIDTAEVKAAKASFQAVYDAAAAAAAAAPDVNIITASKQQSFSVPVITSTYGQEPSAINVASNDGTYQFSYTTHDSSRHESADAFNNVQGNFEFVADDAQRRRVDYKAGAETGFVATGAHLPVSVQDTAAVASAKASFKSAYDAAAAAAEAAPDTNIITGAVPVVAVNTATYSVPAPQNVYLAPAPVQIKYTGPSAPLDASGRVDDTPEVKAAKASFQAVYDAAAAAAAAAPDVNIITASKQQSVSVPVITSTYGQEPSAINVASNDGTYQFSYTTHDSSRHESADAFNNVQGNFEFVADDAQRRRVDYKAGAETGFVAAGAHLPVSVQDTAAVASAKASFKSAYDAAAAAADAAPDTNIITGAIPVVAVNTAAYSVPAPQNAYLAPAPVQIKYDAAPAPVDASGRVVDTAEVKAAKAAFRAAYDAAAAAAAAAPDTNIITGAVHVANTASYGVVAPQTTYFASAPVVAKYDGPAAPVDASGRVVDTAEVKAAKAAFQAAFDAAAAAADAASDDDTISASYQSPSAAYSAGSVPVTQVTYTANHGSMRTITFDGITLMQADGGDKYGYSYE